MLYSRNTNLHRQLLDLFFCHWIAKQIKYSSAFRPKMALTATENIVQYLQSRLWKLNREHIIRNWILNLYEW